MVDTIKATIMDRWAVETSEVETEGIKKVGILPSLFNSTT